jgi:hypothetical protein
VPSSPVPAAALVRGVAALIPKLIVQAPAFSYISNFSQGRSARNARDPLPRHGTLCRMR